MHEAVSDPLAGVGRRPVYASAAAVAASPRAPHADSASNEARKGSGMTLPDHMRAIDIAGAGGPEVLHLVTVPLPAPGDFEVLIRNEAMGVNRPDCVQRQGRYPVPADANPLPGLEVAGEVVALGPKASRWSIGDKVTALTHGGGYAEFTAVHEGHCLPWPKGFDAVKAAALPETFFTVHYNLFMRARLAQGETVLVHGGSSGIGSTAIQLAKAVGATVATTAGTDEKCRFCTSIGADLAINYKTEDWAARAKAFAGEGGVDVVLDMVAGPYIQKNLDLLGRDGRYALIAMQGGSSAQVDFRRLLLNRLVMTGSTLRPQTREEKALIAADLLKAVWPHLDQGRVAPHIHETFPMERAADAHAMMERGEHMGKIVLVP